MADVLERMQDVLSAPNAPGPPRAFDPTDPAAALDPTERPAAMTPTQRYGMTASGVMTRRGGARPAPAPAPTRALAPAAPAAPAWSPYSYAPVAPTAQPAGPQPYSLGKGYNVVPPSQPGEAWLLSDPRGRVTAHDTQDAAEAGAPLSVTRPIQLTPVEHDPYAPAVVTPVEHDPFPQPAVTLTTVDHDPYVGMPPVQAPAAPAAPAWSWGNQAPAPDLATWQTPPVNTVSPGYYGY